MPFAMHSTPNNRRILVGGTLYGAGNLGDEAILEGIQRCLPVGGRAGVCVAGHYDRYSQLGFEVFSDSTADVLRAILWCDEVWVGGGTLLSDAPQHAYPVGRCALFLRLARLLGKPAQFFGIGVTDVSEPALRGYAARTYSLASRLFARNAASAESFKRQIPMPGPRAMTLCDPAFFLQDSLDLADGRALLREQGILPQPGRPWIGISVVNEQFAEGRDYHGKLAQLCRLIHHRWKAQLVLLYSEVREGPFFDRAAGERIRGQLDFPLLELPAGYYPTVRFASACASLDAVITMRLHVAFFAAMGGGLALPVVREDKMQQVCDDLGLRSLGTIDSFDPEVALRLFEMAMREDANARSRVAERIRQTTLAARGLLEAAGPIPDQPGLPGRVAPGCAGLVQFLRQLMLEKVHDRRRGISREAYRAFRRSQAARDPSRPREF